MIVVAALNRFVVVVVVVVVVVLVVVVVVVVAAASIVIYTDISWYRDMHSNQLLILDQQNLTDQWQEMEETHLRLWDSFNLCVTLVMLFVLILPLWCFPCLSQAFPNSPDAWCFGLVVSILIGFQVDPKHDPSCSIIRRSSFCPCQLANRSIHSFPCGSCRPLDWFRSPCFPFEQWNKPWVFTFCLLGTTQLYRYYIGFIS